MVFLSADPIQIEALITSIERFESEINQEVEVRTYSDASYKSSIDQWMADGDYDIVHWQSGRRLNQYVDKDQISPLNEYVDLNTMRQHYASSVIDQLVRGDSLYAMPLAVYGWGFYYNKHIFETLKLSVPKTWQEFVAVCRVLHENGVAPLIQANAGGWESLIWLDFLAFKAGGAPLRKKLVEGMDLNAQEIRRIVEPLRELVERDYFFSPENSWTWLQALAAVSRGKSGMTLTGQFAEQNIQLSMDDKIGYFAFPNRRVSATVAPLDLFVVPKSSNNKQAAALLLNYLSKPEVNAELAMGLGWLPTSNEIEPVRLSSRQRTALEALQVAQTHVQYFDRDAAPTRSAKLNEYINTLLVTQQATRLEKYLSEKVAAEQKEER